ncbi:MAG: GGDEF domain-containing protein [Pseudomonadota bacterium]
MFERFTSWPRAILAAFLTTCGCIAVAEIMVYLFFQGQDLWSALKLAPIISAVTAFPVSLFIWLQVRRNALLNTELQRLVNRDRLTNVATRDFFFSQMREDNEVYGVSLMVDIDYFKTINDTYGHLTGDKVISRVAAILFENSRDRDIVCRFGGEEFAIFLHETETEKGYQIAERMRQAIAAEEIFVEDQTIRITVSIGGSLKERLENIEEAIRQADAALYKAKAGGRNRTIFAGHDPKSSGRAAA